MGKLESLSLKIIHTWLILKYTYGLTFIILGIDKFFNFIAPWEQYVSTYMLTHVPVSAPIFIMGIGTLEIFLGILILAQWTRTGAYFILLWLLTFAVNLFAMRAHYDIALGSIVIAVGAFTLARLTTVKNGLLKNMMLEKQKPTPQQQQQQQTPQAI